MEERHCKLVAEIGASHAGSLKRAIMLTELAAYNGADVVKFQKRNPYKSVPNDIANKPHPNPHFAYGDTYLEHRLNLELDIQDHEVLKQRCDELGVEYGCSVWDMDSAEEIIDIKPGLLKIPSACNMHFNLIEYCLSNFDGMLHISLGMMNQDDRNILFTKFKSKNVIFYHTTTEYPCPFERLYLKEISNIYNLFGQVGFSNHGYGISADIAALALGATFIERHFIDDRTFRHTDAAASLEPNGLKTLKRDIRHVGRALKFMNNECTDEEKSQSLKLRNSFK
jgi:sialic acid synthase